MRATFLIAGVLAAIVASATAARAEVTIALDNQYNTVSGRPPLYGYRGSDAPVVIQPSNRTEFKLGQGVTLIITTHNLALGYEADRVITLEDGRILREEPGRGTPPAPRRTTLAPA